MLWTNNLRLLDMREGWREVAIKELLLLTIGGVWGKKPGEDEVDVDVLRSTNFTKNGTPDVANTARRSVTKKQLASRQLQHGDILLEKSGGGPKQPVGRVIFIDTEFDESVCANFVQLVRPNPNKVVSKFLFMLMWLKHSIGETLSFQSQTTGIRNLRTTDYLDQLVVIPPPSSSGALWKSSIPFSQVSTRTSTHSKVTPKLSRQLVKLCLPSS